MPAVADSITGSYEGLNIDEGNTIYYSGSGSNTNEDPNDPHVSSASRHMRRSMKYSHPVRVLRNSQGNPRWSPSVGIRYDGLYEIVDEEELVNKLGGKFVRFVLVRKRGQNPIQQNRPNPAEKNAFHWLKNSL